MKRLQHIYAILLGIIMLGAQACTDEPVVNPDYTVSGKPVTIKIALSLPEMKVTSRADMGENELNQVNSIWVRTYSSTTRRATSEWVKKENVNHNDKHEKHEITINTLSGYSYIVAVANVENEGAVLNADGTIKEVGTLGTLLEKADTWEQFCAIVVDAPQLYHPYDATVGLPMSGCYYGGDNITDHPDTWQNQNYEQVFIPGADDAKTMNGSIHLRRLVSQIKFKLKAGDKGVKIIPQSFSVINVPRYSWLYERKDSEDKYASADAWKASAEFTNVGDYASSGGIDTYYELESQSFTSEYIHEEEDGYVFDFWQLENKHSALASSSCNEYVDREKENKTSVENPVKDGKTENNSDIYISLSGNEWISNNLATAVRIRCRVEYDNQLNVDDGGMTGDDYKGVIRTGDALFTVHLGYCEGTGEERASDFNCRRNTQYTYNVIVNSVDNIVVEANKNGEPQPGMEGFVSDITGAVMELDCHYMTFNIQLTEDDLTKDFGYVIQAPRADGTLFTCEETDTPSKDDAQYVNWIEFRPTTAENVLAAYKPYEGNNSDGKTFRLTDIKNGLNDDRKSGNNWYTVFINEYAYENNLDENNGGKPNWPDYVNHDPRRAWIKVTQRISADGESRYIRSKYAFSQRSIQTYYDVNHLTKETTNDGITIPGGTAIGVEHTNETLGYNMRRTFTAANDQSNGRYNVWWWLGNSTTAPAEEKNAVKKWNDVLYYDTQQKENPVPMPVLAVDKQNFKQDAETGLLPRLANYTGSLDKGTEYDPQTSITVNNTIEAINACMNRNRDNNGDGTIQADELRWYVPAMGKYLRIILGRGALTTPIMDYDENKNLKYGVDAGQSGKNSRFLLYSSDGRVLWAMEGMSTSNWNEWGEDNPAAPWQVRCIRNLGSNLSTVTKGEKVVKAFEHDEKTSVIRMTYYNPTAVRQNSFSGNGNGEGQMPVHTIADQKYNRAYKAFEYGPLTQWEIWRLNDGSTKNTNRLLDLIKNEKCKNLGLGWRLPNQKELSIMRNLELFDELPNADTDRLNAYAISCTTGYYGTDGSAVSDATKYLLGARKNAVTLLNHDNIQPTGGYDIGIYYRCVRDVE